MSLTHAVDLGLHGGRMQQRHQSHGALLYEFGMSNTAQSYNPTGSPPAIRQYRANGPLNWVRRRLKNAFVINHAWGVGGDTSLGGLRRLTTVLATTPKPEWCFVQFFGDFGELTAWSEVDGKIASWLTNVEGIINTLKNNGIRPLVSIPMMQANWQPTLYKHTAAVRSRAIMQEFAKKNGLPLLNMCPAMTRPESQPAFVCTSLSRTSNVVTAVVTGVTAAGWITGEWVMPGGSIDAGFALTDMVQITMTGTDTFTYSHAGSNGSATNKGLWYRSENITKHTLDGTHLSQLGASKVSLIWEDILEPLFPQVDDLSDTENDYFNLAGSGVAGAASQSVMNRGMMTGTAGTRTGTAVSHTGNVATGWESNVISGNPTSVTCAKVARTEPGYEHQEWQEIAIVAAGGADCSHQLRIQHTLPVDWAASAAKTAGNWVKPTSQNGFFYVALNNGTTGGSQPTWPTNEGEIVLDNGIQWHCRRGYVTGDKFVLMAEYRIVAMSDADALKVLSFGLVDNNNNANSILDFDWNDVPADAPAYQLGENGYFCTPEATLVDATQTQSLCMRTLVAAGKQATVRITRVTFRKVPSATA